MIPLLASTVKKHVLTLPTRTPAWSREISSSETNSVEHLHSTLSDDLRNGFLNEQQCTEHIWPRNARPRPNTTLPRDRANPPQFRVYRNTLLYPLDWVVFRCVALMNFETQSSPSSFSSSSMAQAPGAWDSQPSKGLGQQEMHVERTIWRRQKSNSETTHRQHLSARLL